jgi:hypothetical protein
MKVIFSGERLGSRSSGDNGVGRRVLYTHEKGYVKKESVQRERERDEEIRSQASQAFSKLFNPTRSIRYGVIASNADSVALTE